jgi:hypothetical protein
VFTIAATRCKIGAVPTLVRARRSGSRIMVVVGGAYARLSNAGLGSQD